MKMNDSMNTHMRRKMIYYCQCNANCFPQHL